MIHLKITWKYCLAFYCQIMLFASLHELVHHFTGYMICGEWGYKTFNYFRTACGKTNKMAYLATYAGPLFSFIMMWIGVYWLTKLQSSEWRKQMAFALIFSQLPLQRMIFPFFKMNDEYFASSILFGHSQLVYWSVILIIWTICIPPLYIAFKMISNSNRIMWFLLFLCFLPTLLFAPIFMFLEYLLVTKHVLNGTTIGIAHLFILNEVITIAGYILTKKYFTSN